MLKTEHFDVHYYPEEEEAVRLAARMSERWYARLSNLLDFKFAERQPLILYACQPHFQQTNAVPDQIGEGTGGVTEAFKRRVVLPFAGPLAETDHVLGHELVHAFQFAITGQGRSVSAGGPTALRLPLWFIEGMAEYLSVGPVDPHTAMWMRDAVKRNKLPALRDLDDPRYFPYRWGQAFWAYVAGRFGDPVVGAVLKAAGRSGNAEGAIESVLGIKAEDLSKQWHEALREAYKPLVERKALGDDYPGASGRPLITRKTGGGRINVGPAASPDGTQIVFLSEKDLFSVELFVADARSGEVKTRLSRTAVDPHFDSLQFINSAGAWDARGVSFAFGAVSEGRPVLSIVDVASGRTVREIRFDEVDEVFTPSWSPDGRSIVFSALTGGFTDLFVYDLQTRRLRRMTADPYADLHPAWSPDGKSIAFATDRFSSRLEDLHMGNYRLALLDVASGEIRRLPSFEHGKNVNPQWGPDPNQLYFLSDRGGATNVYRLDRRTAEIAQLTDLFTGVSGITALSPALSVSSSAGRVTFSLYNEDRYDIYAIDHPEKLAGRTVSADATGDGASMLPPLDRVKQEVLALKQDPDHGLPDGRSFKVTDYRPSLSLDYAGQPYVAAGTDRFGTYIGGGISLSFSDLLGDHSLGAVLQVEGGLDDVAAILAYQNRKRRLNWGAYAGQVPYVTGSFSTILTRIDGEPAVVEEAVLFRQTERQAGALLAYPFSRAQRVELSGGYRNITFQREIERFGYSRVDGRILLDERTKSPLGDSLNLVEGSAALVHDTSSFGATSPILGRRYRLEFSPAAGSVTYSSALADFRQYLMPARPFTLAGRVLHFGRYGRDAEDSRLVPLYLGYATLVRGWNVGSFRVSECGEVEDQCPIFDQTVGSRLLVANFELRFPLLGLFGAERFYGPFPIEAAVFYDTGVAWTRQTKPSIFGGERERVASAGFTGRVNFFGYAVIEVDYVRPLDRPKRGWLWQFNFSPGF